MESPIDNKKGCTKGKNTNWKNIKLIQIYFVSTVKLAASVPLAPTPCALQMTQRNHDYEVWQVAEERSYQNDCIDLEAVEAWNA